MESDKQLAGLKAQLRETASKLAQREQELAYFREQIEAVQQDHQHLCELVASLRASAVAQENAALREENERLVADFELLEKRVNELAAIHLLDQQEKELMALELDRLHQDNERKSQDRQRTIEIYEERLSKLRRLLQANDSDIQQLRLENEILRQEAEEYQEGDPKEALEEEIRTLRTEYRDLETQIEERNEEKSVAVDEETARLWREVLIHALLIAVPAGKKAEIQRFCEEIDSNWQDSDFVSEIPHRVSTLLKDSKSPMPTSRPHKRPSSDSPKGSLALRVIAQLQDPKEAIFQLHDLSSIQFIGGSKEAVRDFQLDAVYVETEAVEREIREVVGLQETAPVLVLIEGAGESDSGELFGLAVSIAGQELMAAGESYFGLREVSETESVSIYPPADSADKSEEQQLIPLISSEQFAGLLAPAAPQLPCSHLVLSLFLSETQRSIHIVRLHPDEPLAHEVLCKVLSALYAQRHHVPYRNSLLTESLKEALEPDVRVLAILAVHQTAIEESLKVLQFGGQLIAQREAAVSRQRALALNLPGQGKKSSVQIGKETAD